MKIHFLHPDGSPYEEGESFPSEMQQNVLTNFFDALSVDEKEALKCANELDD